MSAPDLDEWRHRLSVALLRYEEANRRVGETAVERLQLPQPDGATAHMLALQQETEALREYKKLLTAFAKLVHVDPLH